MITVVFQPHLYSRTQDFAQDFAVSLSSADQLILLDIYPAREAPIVGVDSKMLLDLCTNPKKETCTKQELLKILEGEDLDVLLTLGAGDISALVQPIKHMLN
jgi:UDP-N-acetylmuramate--alanine ligase